tara:strand:+ start:2541 stop:5165 length:2625 start_codon:yes stop_codon:yes gene_type:complete
MSSFDRLINGMDILRMPAGEGDGGGDSTASGFDPAAVAQASLEDLKNQEKKKEILKEIATSLGNNLEAAKQEIELDRIKLNGVKDYLKELKKKGDSDLAAIQNQTKIREEFDKILKASSLSSDQQKEFNNIQLDTIAGLDEAVEKIEKFRSQQEISKDFADDIASGTAKLARNMGIAADFSKTAAGKFAEMGQKFFSGDKAANTEAIMGAISGMVNPANILGSLIDIAAKKMFELNKAAIGLKVATGFTNDFQSEMTSLTVATIDFGIKLEDSNKALEAVYKNITNINNAAPGLAKNLGESAAMMGKLGVSAETATKGQNLLLKSFGMSGPKITSTLEGMAVNAKDLGLTAESMGSQFNSSMGYLSSFGEEGIAAFKDLASQAGVTGLAIEKMLGMTKAFDKFSEGAKKAATLNSVLGTSLSSMALMTMNPAERMKELRNQINNATGGVKNMTQAQKLFTAEAMGYSSVLEMMADLEASPAEMAEKAAIAKQQADIQKRLADAATELLPLMDRISMAFEALATNEDAINALASAFEFLTGFVVFAIENFKILGPTMLILKGLSIASAYQKRIEARALQQLQIETLKQIGANTAAAASDASTIAMTGAKTAATSAHTLALKLNRIAMAGTVLGLLALMAAFLISGSPQLYMMPLVMAGSIILMTIALRGMQGQAIVAAFVLALLAGAMALVFYGIAAVVESITGLFTVLIQSVDVLPILAMNMYLLGSAFLFLGASAMFGSMGIFMGLAGLTALFLLFKLTGTSMADMFGAGDEILKIGTGIEKFGQGLNNIRSAVGELKSLIGEEGIFAGSVAGDTSSLIMGQGTAVAKLFKNSKIEVDVKMPEISMPKVEVKVYIGSEELKDIIRKEITSGQR